MFGKNNKDIDYKRLNDVIGLTNKILKILYIMLFIGVLYIGLIFLKETKIIDFVLTALSIVSPLFIGIIIMWLFNPFIEWMKRKKIKRVWGAVITYILIIGVLVLVIGAIIPLLSEQLYDFASSLPQIFSSIEKWINDIFNSLDKIKGLDSEQIRFDLFTNLQKIGTDLTTSLPEILVNLVKVIFSGIVVLVVGLIIGFYLLVSFDGTDAIISFLPKKIQKTTLDLAKEIDASLRGFVEGALITSTFVFIISSIGLWLVGLKSPLLFGLFCGITNVIPYIGPYIGGIPAVIVGFSMSPEIGILSLVVVFIIQILEGNFIQPLVMSKTTKLHPVTIMIGLLLFGYFWGIIGMVVATPVIASIKTVLLFYDDKYHILKFNKEIEEEKE